MCRIRLRQSSLSSATMSLLSLIRSIYVSFLFLAYSWRMRHIYAATQSCKCRYRNMRSVWSVGEYLSIGLILFSSGLLPTAAGFIKVLWLFRFWAIISWPISCARSKREIFWTCSGLMNLLWCTCLSYFWVSIGLVRLSGRTDTWKGCCSEALEVFWCFIGSFLSSSSFRKV